MEARSYQIIGILNVTPDSYVDGGQFSDVDRAVKHAGALLQQGADWVEIGGESTGPGSSDVPLEEELRRVLPVVEMVRREYPDARIAVDTYKAEVARRALAAGVGMINDISAGRADDEMLSVLAASDALYCMMHAKDATPRTTVDARIYTDVVADIKSFLQERIDAAASAGIGLDRLILDPGLGHFVSSEARYSFEILAQMQEFVSLGAPVLVSPSRKSFLAGSEQLPPAQRLPGTVAASAIAVERGATYIRTHDVGDVAKGCAVAAEIRSAAEKRHAV